MGTGCGPGRRQAGDLRTLLALGSRSFGVLGFSGWHTPVDPNRIPWLLLQAYDAGDAMPTPWAQWVPLAYLALALIGAAAWTRRRASGHLSERGGARCDSPHLAARRAPA